MSIYATLYLIAGELSCFKFFSENNQVVNSFQKNYLHLFPVKVNFYTWNNRGEVIMKSYSSICKCPQNTGTKFNSYPLIVAHLTSSLHMCTFHNTITCLVYCFSSLMAEIMI